MHLTHRKYTGASLGNIVDKSCTDLFGIPPELVHVVQPSQAFRVPNMFPCGLAHGPVAFQHNLSTLVQTFPHGRLINIVGVDCHFLGSDVNWEMRGQQTDVAN